MAIEWTPIIVATISGLGAGVVGSLIAPWAQWKIEEVRERVKSRRDFIESCRKLISCIPSDQFRETTEYARLRPYLSNDIIERIENDTLYVQKGGRGKGVNNFVPKLHDEVTALEKKWKLV